MGAATATQSKADPPEKHAKKKKEKPPKMTHVVIENGMLTVDGWTGKAELNYDILDLKFLYFYAPGVGTAVVSNVFFPGAIEQREAFNENALSFLVNGHAFQLSSDKRLLSKKPESVWVKLDSGYQADARYPVMGYGSVSVAPYVWPGAQPKAMRAIGTVVAPPLPSAFRPKLIVQPCVTSAGLPCAPQPQPASQQIPVATAQSASGSAPAPRTDVATPQP